MKLFRRKEPRSSHPHAQALEHIQNAHKALMRDDATAGRVHLGKAFAAVHHTLPKTGKVDPDTDAMMEPDSDPDDPTPPVPKGSPTATTAPFQRLRSLNRT